MALTPATRGAILGTIRRDSDITSPSQQHDKKPMSGAIELGTAKEKEKLFMEMLVYVVNGLWREVQSLSHSHNLGSHFERPSAAQGTSVPTISEQREIAEQVMAALPKGSSASFLGELGVSNPPNQLSARRICPSAGVTAGSGPADRPHNAMIQVAKGLPTSLGSDAEDISRTYQSRSSQGGKTEGSPTQVMRDVFVHLLHRDHALKEEFLSTAMGPDVSKGDARKALRLNEPWGSMVERVDDLKAEWREKLGPANLNKRL
ncbi:hypothetical protein P168DRAFT_317275 [Aspergillus campestris IBT 28561]|uniref:Uncharacterized protein n=1 Tax=Aspergillus campestris (strain IBT 28561) TaxID=1392248 RepID=A0A2I1D7D4_ASPC2|nr:uncharacterized protein P168DRAFT_317275 [Aspergillus campestris IBT 28561]PKY05763.1 hypothetical protein P168DRAFT_317275 [Aspergillus campestris IBT 28561]